MAIPFLIIDSPAPAEGVVTSGEDAPTEDIAAPAAVTDDSDAIETQVLPKAVEIVVVSESVSPDISRLADHAGTWGSARAQAIADGRVLATAVPPPSNTNLALLPVTPKPVEPEPAPEAPTDEPEPPAEEPEAPDEEVPAEPEEPGQEPAEPPTDPDEEPAPEPAPAPAPQPDEPPVVKPVPEAPTAPTAPTQVDGRVPPPTGGPTAAQWNLLRRCESTHNYRAISPSGLYRGAYQFSQQTWDWVAGIHQPHLVGIDPIDAEPAWQDIMAYTLYAMRGWDQWPICGKNLL